MKISLSITNYSWSDGLASHLGEVTRIADQGGLDTVWVADHLLQADPASKPDEAMLEAYTTLGFLAARTERIRLGTMVAGVTFRIPSLLIKAVTTLDALSNGRDRLGIGVGYEALETKAMGIPMPPTAERFDRLEETLQLAIRMWSGDDSPFEGRHYRLERPLGRPLPVNRPPILIGGMGERKTLRLVARYGDACNLFDIPDGGRLVRHKLDVLAGHCETEGRPYDEIEKTLSTALEPGESAASFAERCRAIADLGIEQVVVITSGTPWTADTVKTLTSAVTELTA